MKKLTFFAIPNIPMIEPGDDLVSIIGKAIMQTEEKLLSNDIVVVAQKIISKAENRYINLADVVPSQEAKALALEVNKDPRHVQVILSESKEVVKKKRGVLIVEHKLGFVHANAGVDRSNINKAQLEQVLLLPVAPDASARCLREGLQAQYGVQVGVIINDTSGRAWRNGLVGMALGVAGLTALEDHIGAKDLYDHPLEVTQVAVADELSAGASLLMGQKDEKTPVVVIRGYRAIEPSDKAQQGVKPLLRPKELDLFR